MRVRMREPRRTHATHIYKLRVHEDTVSVQRLRGHALQLLHQRRTQASASRIRLVQRMRRRRGEHRMGGSRQEALDGHPTVHVARAVRRVRRITERTVEEIFIVRRIVGTRVVRRVSDELRQHDQRQESQQLIVRRTHVIRGVVVQTRDVCRVRAQVFRVSQIIRSVRPRKNGHVFRVVFV